MTKYEEKLEIKPLYGEIIELSIGGKIITKNIKLGGAMYRTIDFARYVDRKAKPNNFAYRIVKGE